MIPGIRQCEVAVFPPAILGMVTKEQSELKDRLRDVRATQQDLADYMGISLKAVNRIVNPEGRDGRKKLSTTEIEQIRSFFAQRERPLYTMDSDNGGRRGVSAHVQGAATIPLFTGIDTPEGYVLSIGTVAQHGRVMAHPSQASAREAYAVTIVDDSMSPRFETGEIAYVIPGQQPRKGQDCLAEFDNLTARVLQFVERRDKQVILRQMNPPKEIIKRATEVKVHAIVGRG